MGADHILEFEVVTADGRFITANKDRNSDLFWALRGGGGSTFGVVTSVVVKAYKTVPVTTVSWAYSQSATVSEASFWDAFKTYMSLFPKMADAGVYSYFQMFPGTFNMQSLFCPNLSKTQVQALMAPLTKKLADLKIPFSPVFTEYTSFYPAWKAAFPKEAIGQANVQTASRLFPRANWVDPAKFEATYKAVKDVVSQGLILIAFNIAPTTTAGRVGVDETAVNPAWRNTLFHAITGVGWAENATQAEIQAARSELTNVHMKKWRDVSPGAGAYLGESDINEPNFQQAFYGTKYDRLYEIKQKYDPHGVFYAATAVGSEDWKLDSRGRLCPV